MTKSTPFYGFYRWNLLRTDTQGSSFRRSEARINCPTYILQGRFVVNEMAPWLLVGYTNRLSLLLSPYLCVVLGWINCRNAPTENP